jgi:hypothetical protein
MNLHSDDISLVILYYHLDFVLSLTIGIGLYRAVTFHDAVFNMSIIANINIVQDDRVLNITVITDERFFEDKRIFNRSINDTST